jgi:hypothetical protein
MTDRKPPRLVAEERARHAGNADVLREMIDGETGR